MCRIAGIIHPELHPDELRRLVTGMCGVQQHGGPDDEGFFYDEKNHLALGHRRLSIIDNTVAGHQPMQYQNGDLTITYNGEIYNYRELRVLLEHQGHTFKTQSDTEVILAAYHQWGVSSFEKLDGMFAFGIWDNRSCELTLVRDSSGIKPLYYCTSHNSVAFASEVRAFSHTGYVTASNNEWPVYMMAYGHLPEPVTTLAGVQPLAKGTFLQFHSSSGRITTNVFHRYFFVEKIQSHSEAVSLIKEGLEMAVKRHLIADVPVGVFLSGGLDSGILTLLANRHQQKLNTVSIYFEQDRYSEKKYQDALQKKLDCTHHQFLLTENEFHEKIPSVINAMDLPCCDGINTWFISGYARQSGLKAVLSGVGGDELLGGYPSFSRIKMASLLEKIPGAVLRSGSLASSKKIKRLSYLNIKSSVGRYLFLRGHFVPADIASFLDIDEKQVWQILETAPQLPGIDYLTPANQASWLETNMYMQNQLLRDADVMGMAHGVEIRVPFLDRQFMQMVMCICSNIKYSGSNRKQLLIDSFKDILPPEIWNRPKMGFSFPFREWLANDKYAGGNNLAAYHQKFKEGKLHWSQFFTMYLIKSAGHGR